MEKKVRKNPCRKDREGVNLLHKLRAVLLLTSFILVGTISFAQKSGYTLTLKNASLTQVMDFVKQKSNYYFLYKDNDIKNTKGINVNVKNGTIKQLLDQALAGKNISYSIENKTITLRKKNIVTQKTEQKVEAVVMFGKVIDKQGNPIPGASVFVKDTQNGMSTDIDGKFEITSLPTNKPIIVSFIGMETREIPLKKGEFNVVLQEDKQVLDEVVVTGYQTISKERATGSFAVVNSNKLKDNLETNILSRLQGKVAGLVSYRGKTSIRGVSTLRGISDPLYVVDGLPLDAKNLESINPAIIKNITVLKDAAAASIYGARAANGVIVISTKQGSSDGKLHINYDGGIRFTPIADIGSLNLINTRELIDFMKYQMKFSQDDYNGRDIRQPLDPVEELLLKKKAGLITETQLEEGLDVYRKLDNRKQIEDFYLRTGILHHHNLSLSGGTAKNRYFASVNYKDNAPNSKFSNNQDFGFTLRDNIKFLDWLSGDFIVAANFSKSYADRGVGSAGRFYKKSYIMLRDTKGNPIPIEQGKSPEEIERLKKLGLKDETYSPIWNQGKETQNSRSDYRRINLNLNAKIIEGLDLSVMYQAEKTNSKSKILFDKNSFRVHNMINNAAQIKNGELVLNVPEGAQLRETRSDDFSHTFRTQLNFLKQFDKHYITAIAGAERRQEKNTYTSIELLGYDDSSLSYTPVNPLLLAQIEGTQSIEGYFAKHIGNTVYEKEDRFVSFYGNASYIYDEKYGLTGSIRVDESNLFGTDPKYRYRPLWSVGASWAIHKEDFMKDTEWVNMLKLRTTYGIGGNIPRGASPYLILKAPFYDYWTHDLASSIKNPPNDGLRWEKTATTNLGVDFSLFDYKLNGTIEVYKKHTTDLLAYRRADPTLGNSDLLLNYGAMENKGIEVSLNSQLKFGELYWSPALNFSYNKNKVLEVDQKPVTVFDYIRGDITTAGYPMGTIFSVRYAGLSEKDGTPLFYTAKGEKVSEITSTDDVVHSGTRVPKYVASLNNSLSYKNFDLSFLFTYYGGHVMRGEKAPYLSYGIYSNANREVLNIWKKPGDEKDPNTAPAIAGKPVYFNKSTIQYYQTADNVFKADYVKLQNLAVGYTLTKDLLPKLPIESLRLSLQVQNVFTWAANDRGFNPEAMGTKGYGYGARKMEIPTIYTVGLSVKF